MFGVDLRGAICALCVPVANSAQVIYQVAELGAPFSSAGINDLGEHAGTINCEAKFWSHETGLIDLGDLAPPFDRCDYAVAINSQGAIVGQFNFSEMRGFLWTRGEGMRMAGPNYLTQIVGMNDLNWVVGTAARPGVGEWEAFYWTELGGTTHLPRLPDQYDAVAWGVNNDGEIVGTAILEDQSSTGFFWSEAAGLHRIGPMPDGMESTYVGDINSQGFVAGLTSGTIGSQYSFVWSLEGGFEVIEATRELDLDGGCWMINDRGEVIGRGSWNPGEFEDYLYRVGSHGPLFRFTRRIDPCETVELRSAFPLLFQTSDISNRGQIVGRLSESAGGGLRLVLTPTIAADTDLDGDTDLYDLAVTLTNFGRGDSALTFEQGDVDEDRDVDLEDVAHILINFGRRCSGT